MTRVAVTGSTGYIGRAVVQALASRDVDVLIRAHRPEGTQRLDRPQRHHVVDLLDPESVEASMSQLQPSHLIHLAWDVSHGDYWESSTNDDWKDASIDLARSFVRNGGRRMVVAGSCAESAPALRTTKYASAKLHVLEQLSAIDGLELVWLRIFFPVGPYEDERRLVPSMTRTLLDGNRFVVRQPSLVRDFGSVDDVGRAFAAAALGSHSGVYDIGTGIGTSLGEVARIVSRAVGREELVDFGADTAPDPLIADTDGVAADFGLIGMISPCDALVRAVEWWKDHRQMTENRTNSAAIDE